MVIMPRDSYYANDYRIQIAFTSHYVSLRIKKRWSSIMPSKRHGHWTPVPCQFKSITWKTCTRRARCSYLRIDVSLNTLFIFVRYIPHRWNPPRGEARSTGNHERAPAVMIYRGTLDARVRVQAGVYTHTRASRWLLCLPGSSIDTSGVISSEFGPYYIFSFFLSFFFLRRRGRN